MIHRLFHGHRESRVRDVRTGRVLCWGCIR